MIIKYGMVGADHKGGVALAAFSFLLRKRVKEGRKEGMTEGSTKGRGISRMVGLLMRRRTGEGKVA